MQIIKFLMLIMLFISSTLIGIYISKKYSYRLKELEEIKNALNILKTKIKFTYEPIPEIFREISEKVSINISNIFKEANKKMKTTTAAQAWENAIDESENNLNTEDKQVIKTLSKLLRNNRCRWTIKPDRSNRKFFGESDKTSTRREK